MTDRITQKVSPMKEYGRKPYLVTKETVPIGEQADYRYMMDTTWAKAQDNEYIVVQSVKKKPYQQQDYQMMENLGDGFTGIKWDMPKFDYPFIKPKPNPIPPDDTSQQTIIGGIKWIKCPTEVAPSSSYTIIVQNSVKTQISYKNGKVIGLLWLNAGRTQNTYIPSQLWLKKITGDATGLSLTNIQFRGNTTWATLITSLSADGKYYIKATDGKTIIKHEVEVSAKVSWWLGATLNVDYGFTYYWIEIDSNFNPTGVVKNTIANISKPTRMGNVYTDVVNGNPGDTTYILNEDGGYYKGSYYWDDTVGGEAIQLHGADAYHDWYDSGGGDGGDYICFYDYYVFTGDDSDHPHTVYGYLDIKGTLTLLSTYTYDIPHASWYIGYTTIGSCRMYIDGSYGYGYKTDIWDIAVGGTNPYSGKLAIFNKGVLVTKDFDVIGTYWYSPTGWKITINGTEYVAKKVIKGTVI